MKQFQEVITDEANDPFWPDKKDFPVKSEHLARYYFVNDYIEKYLSNKNIKVIYDMASGLGFGVKTLARPGRKIYGFDINQDYINYSKKNYSAEEGEFIQFDIEKNLAKSVEDRFPKPQVITSFETIEHLNNPDEFLKQCSKILNSGDYLFCSVPNEKYDPKTPDGKPKIKYHKHLFTKQDIIELVEENDFEIIEFLGQPIPNILYNNFKPLLKLIDFVTLKTRKRFEFFTRKLAYPTKRFNKLTYSFVIVARKK